MMASLLSVLLIATPAPAQPAASTTAISAFTQLCLSDLPAARAGAILSLADAAGWRKSGGDRQADSVDGTLTLHVDDSVSAGETRESCGVSLDRPAPSLVSQVNQALGVAPSFAAAGSATFLAVRTATGWRAAGTLTPAESIAAKQAGVLFSVMVLDAGGQHPSVVALHVLPGAP